MYAQGRERHNDTGSVITRGDMRGMVRANAQWPRGLVCTGPRLRPRPLHLCTLFRYRRRHHYGRSQIARLGRGW